MFCCDYALPCHRVNSSTYSTIPFRRNCRLPYAFYRSMHGAMTANCCAISITRTIAERRMRRWRWRRPVRHRYVSLNLRYIDNVQNPEERINHLKAASKFFSEHKDRAFESKMAEEAHRLLSLQLQYEKELDHKFVFAGLTVDAFISILLIEGAGKRAEHVRAAWKVPDKRWWWLKIKALSTTHNWEGLETFAKSKKSPIGYEPFVVSPFVAAPLMLDSSSVPHTTAIGARGNLCRAMRCACSARPIRSVWSVGEGSRERKGTRRQGKTRVSLGCF